MSTGGRSTPPSYRSTEIVVSSAIDGPCERDTLNGRGRRHSANTLIGVAMLLFAALSLLFETSVHAIHQCPLSYEARAHEREVWQREVFMQELLRQEWQHEKQGQENLRQEWALEQKHHEESIEMRRRHEEEYEESIRQTWQKEIESHLEHQGEQRREWEVEKKNHEHELEQQRLEWQHELEEYDRRMYERRLEWQRQAAAYRQEMDKQRLEWKREWDEHDRRERERRQRDKQERQKMDMFWGQVEAHHCTTYATREYTALLKNLPTDYRYRVEACRETPLEIHGVSYLPKDCEDKGPGVVIGRWEVNQNEAACVTFWNWYKDKGCTSEGSGKRRIEHYLENLPKGSDWREFCSTTPASFLGMHFPGAEICFQENLGTYGHWEIEDYGC
ncbi:hypothetical protein J3A83DRAFT_4186212 [Scleroderma citrinum]